MAVRKRGHLRSCEVTHCDVINYDVIHCDVTHCRRPRPGSALSGSRPTSSARPPTRAVSASSPPKPPFRDAAAPRGSRSRSCQPKDAKFTFEHFSTGGGGYKTNHFSEWLVLFHELSRDWSFVKKNSNFLVIGLIKVKSVKMTFCRYCVFNPEKPKYILL